jgi:hypothetical protein
MTEPRMPPEKKRPTEAQLPAGQDQTRLRDVTLTSEKRKGALGRAPCLQRIGYWLRLADRYLRGDLEFFRCHNCHKLHLDPIGRDGKREWLCADCSDPERPV